jgi:hypothetical protein
LLYLLNNKNINPTFLFLSVVKSDPLQQVFQELSGVPTLVEILKYLLISYPNLIKSKIIKENTIKILKNKKQKQQKQTLKKLKNVNNRKSKKNL